MKLTATVLLVAATLACQTAPPAWNAPADDGPVLCGTVLDPHGRPVAGIEVRPYAGFATRFPGPPVRTDAEGHYRIYPVTGSLMFSDDGLADLFVGVCVGTISSGNPAAFLPWQDVHVSQEPGTVVVLDFVFDRVKVAERSGNSVNL